MDRKRKMKRGTTSKPPHSFLWNWINQIPGFGWQRWVFSRGWPGFCFSLMLSPPPKTHLLCLMSGGCGEWRRTRRSGGWRTRSSGSIISQNTDSLPTQHCLLGSTPSNPPPTPIIAPSTPLSTLLQTPQQTKHFRAWQKQLGGHNVEKQHWH